MRINAPEEICLYEEKNLIKTLKFIQNIYEMVNVSSEIIKIDFANTTNMTAAASVVLFAHINYLQLRTKPNRFIFENLALNDTEHKDFLTKIYAKALRAGSVQALNRLETSNNLYQSGILPHEKLPYLKVFFRNIRMQLGEESLLLPTISLLETAVYEALLNVHHHAYLNVQGEPTRWWQYLYFDPTKKTLTFIIYDLGIGIIESFIKHSEKKTTSLFHSKTDILKETLKPGVSRWNQIERGNGLADMMKPTLSDVAVWILTNQVYLEKSPQFDIDLCYETSYSLPGTLVEWHFELRNNNENEKN